MADLRRACIHDQEIGRGMHLQGSEANEAGVCEEWRAPPWVDLVWITRLSRALRNWLNNH